MFSKKGIKMSCDCYHNVQVCSCNDVQVGKIRYTESVTGNCSSPPQVKDHSDGILSTLDALLGNLNDLRQCVDSLEKRLYPVLSQVPTTPAKDSNNKSCDNSLKQKIIFIQDTIITLSLRIHDINGRVEL